MNFASAQFYLFFVVVFMVYWQLGKSKQNLFLLLASYFFYACWDWRFLGLIVISTLSNYYCGKSISLARETTARKRWLVLAIVINIGILAYFKYTGFMVDSFISLSNGLGMSFSRVTLEITLPVGISFYIFQSLSYSLDIYRKQLTPDHSLLDFATFVAFFPQLVAGPIVRAKEFLYQLEAERKFCASDFEQGLIRFLTGLFKKVFIADNLAVYLVDPVFSSPGTYSSSILWLAMFAYAIQIYADFSGYSNMAIGCAKMLGFKLPENFNYPYLAVNFSDFWKRWHTTMSRFFRDYVYIALGGNRKGEVRTIVNLAITTSVSGLWHGASWTFVSWGILHGVYIAINHQINGIKVKMNRRLFILLGWLATQLSVCFAWILFRSSDFSTAWLYLSRLFNTSGSGSTIELPFILLLCFVFFIVDHAFGYCKEYRITKESDRNSFFMPGVYVAMILLLYHGQVEQANPFIYFQF